MNQPDHSMSVTLRPAPAQRSRPRRGPLPLLAALYVVLLLVLLGAARIALAATAVPVQLALSTTAITATVDGQTVTMPATGTPTALVFVPQSPTAREYQLDGTDATNNQTEDPGYLARIASSPYYRFQASMRDFASYDSWRDLRLSTADGAVTNRAAVATTGVPIELQQHAASTLDVNLLRPEMPMQVQVLCGPSPCYELTIDRNDHYIEARLLLPSAPSNAADAAQRIYFPMQPLPFAAEVLYFILEVLIWATFLLGAGALAAVCVCVLPDALVGRLSRVRTSTLSLLGRMREQAGTTIHTQVSRLWRVRRSASRQSGIDTVALLLTLCSCAFTLWIAIVQYQSEPHILDASAYLFQAKIFAAGHLTAPAPPDPAAFQGPFMILAGNRWFAQYPPATSAVLALGLLLHAPEAVEPVLGTLALWGIYCLGKRMFGPRTALLALLLGAISPFYSYLAASYMSHTIALFCGVYFVHCLLRYCERLAVHDLILAGLCAGGLLLSRELTAAVLCVPVVIYLAILYRKRLWQARAQVAATLPWAFAIIALDLLLYGAYNLALTGSPFVPPREIFSPADRYGFGVGIGFYGRHTLAAGLMNLDEQLTSLAIDLFGWPFYLSLALIPCALLHPLGKRRWDVFCLLVGGGLILAQVGYFYHGIYLGPRYLFDALPYLLLLTARGLTGLTTALNRLASALAAATQTSRGRRPGAAISGVLFALLCACTFIYYLPRQIELHTNFTGLSAGQPLDAHAIYAYHPTDSIILTDNWYIYNYVLWPLNDPLLRGSTLYAYGTAPGQLATLRADYPHRALYKLVVLPTGAVAFEPLAR